MDDLDLNLYPMATTFISVAFYCCGITTGSPTVEFKINLFQIMDPHCLTPFINDQLFINGVRLCDHYFNQNSLHHCYLSLSLTPHSRPR